MKKTTVLERLMDEGYFTDEKSALPWVMKGAVLVGSVPARSLMARVDASLPLTVKGFSMPYVSKGGLKLSGAIRAFGVEVSQRVCMDAGACTGGFTDCLIKHGAALVYAVEVGFGQLHGSLRQNPRVVNLERTNLGDESLLSLSPRPQLGCVDLSYLSLRKAIPLFSAIMHGDGELLCLVKPLFETEDPEARRTGRIDPESYSGLLRALCADVDAMPGLSVAGVCASTVTGNHGTHEFFIHVRHGAVRDQSRQAQIEGAVQAALALNPYKKS